MDRSMDSIGSCSLDVDAESSELSDTSGSLNFPTPISIKDITKEFTANIRERCSVQTVKNNTTAYVDPVTGQVCIALTQQPATATTNTINTQQQQQNNNTQQNHSQKQQSPLTPDGSFEKKPSYLNLACCVNGYSNITTYDSKIRQDINKSREVSPIRPSSSSLQYCKKSNSLAPPVLLAMPNVNVTSPTATQHHHHHHQHQSHHQLGTNSIGSGSSVGSKYTIIENNNHTAATNGDYNNTTMEPEEISNGVGGSKRSFIQQRVERLYGPGALAQGFMLYSPKKQRENQIAATNTQHTNGSATSELARKFQELSPSKDYNQFRKKLSSTEKSAMPANGFSTENTSISSTDVTDSVKTTENNNTDLPCLRHLSQHFRAQLNIVSPKRSFTRTSPGRENSITTLQKTPPATITNGHSLCQADAVAALEVPPAIAQIEKSQNNTVDVDELDRMMVAKVEEAVELQTATTPIVKVEASALESTPVLSIIQLEETEVQHEFKTPLSVPATNGSDLCSTPTTTNSLVTCETTAEIAETPLAVKDAHFFLGQLKAEQNRLIDLAVIAEKYLDALASNPDITEDTLGLLRSASGKARLLVSQKMKQFEGLCHKHLNCSPEDQFPTTLDDLQGFWDMVYLQVDHINAIFEEIELVKKNDWKRPKDLKPITISGSKSTPRPNKTPLSSRAKVNTPVANGSASATPTAAALKREAQRKKLQEIKRRNREALQQQQQQQANDATNESSTSSVLLLPSTEQKADTTDDS